MSEQKEKLKDKLEREFSNRTKEKQIRFLNEAIDTLESFKQDVVHGRVTIEDASMNTGLDVPTIMGNGGRNISIDIDFQENKQNIN